MIDDENIVKKVVRDVLGSDLDDDEDDSDAMGKIILFPEAESSSPSQVLTSGLDGY